MKRSKVLISSAESADPRQQMGWRCDKRRFTIPDLVGEKKAKELAQRPASPSLNLGTINHEVKGAPCYAMFYSKVAAAVQWFAGKGRILAAAGQAAGDSLRSAGPAAVELNELVRQAPIRPREQGVKLADIKRASRLPWLAAKVP